MNQRTLRLKEMDALLARGIQNAGDDFIERQAIEAIVRHAFCAGVPPLTYLREKFTPVHHPLSVIETSETQFKCPSCNRSFGSQMALNGHMKKHAISNPSIQS